MNKREFERKKRIERVIATIKATKDKVIDFKKLKFQIMFEYGCSDRTAREYIDTAKSQC